MGYIKISIVFAITALLALSSVADCFAQQDIVKIGLNYPQTGPYAKQGKDQWYAAQLARKEINDAGGILGKKVVYRWYDSASNPDKTKANLAIALNREKVKMVFGGSSSAVAIISGKLCKEKDVLFFATLSYSNATTGKEGHTHVFRECYSAWMAAKAIAKYLNKNFQNAKYFYITADYTWGWSTEASMRRFTGTEDLSRHPRILTPFPSGYYDDALEKAQKANPDVLVLTLFGQEMANAVRKAEEMGLKNKMQIVVPSITLGMAEKATPQAMQGVISTTPWCYKVPYKYNYPRGIEFVEKFKKQFNRYPSTSGASAYAIMHEYKAAVERAGTFETKAVIQALEGHRYQYLKDEQVWRKFDHQSVQTVYTVRCNPAAAVLDDRTHLNYFTIIDSVDGNFAARTRKEWNDDRKAAGKPTYLE